MAGADFSKSLQAVIAEMAASPKDIKTASDRAARRTMQYLRGAIATTISDQLGIPKGKLKTRVTFKRSNGETPQWVLFVGLNRMPYDVAGPVSQNRTGLVHKGGVVKGGFYESPFRSGMGGWIRKKRAKDLGLKLPGLNERSGTPPGKLRHKFPLLRISHDLGISANAVTMTFEKQAYERFVARFDHELRNIKRSK